MEHRQTPTPNNLNKKERLNKSSSFHATTSRSLLQFISLLKAFLLLMVEILHHLMYVDMHHATRIPMVLVGASRGIGGLVAAGEAAVRFSSRGKGQLRASDVPKAEGTRNREHRSQIAELLA